MNRLLTLSLCTLLATTISFVGGQPAKASGDYGCDPRFKLAKNAFSGCDNSAMLGPANDTRVNLWLLMKDGRPPVRPGTSKPGNPQRPVFFDWDELVGRFGAEPELGDGDTCQSSDTGANDFQEALTRARLPEAERTILANLRKGLAAACGKAPDYSQAENQVRSAEGRIFLTYLQGASAFYSDDYEGASRRFASVASATSPWPKEAARYMLGRVEVNRAQVGAFDEYGGFKDGWKADPKVIAAGSAALDSYLRDYPKGAYAASARGLRRRVFWLGRQTDKLAAEYARLMAPGASLPDLDDAALAQEIDYKLLDSSGFDPMPVAPGKIETKDPLLLTVLDLFAMRGPTWQNDQPVVISRADLEAQRPLFANRKDLFDLLLATRAFYIDKQPAEVLRLIPDAARQKSFTSVEFSRQMLRGLALEATKDRNARGFWLEMITGATGPYQRDAIELAIAHHDERAGAVDKVFGAGSLVSNPTVREILLEHAAGPELLRRQATGAASEPERVRALDVLLYKELSRGRYADFLKDVNLIPATQRTQPAVSAASPDVEVYIPNKPVLWLFAGAGDSGDFGCLKLAETAKRLAAQPQNPNARLCLADFFRANGFDHEFLDSPPDKTDLGGAPSQFPGKAYSRLEVYKQVIADPKAPANDKAYALYRAVYCYAPAGNNDCAGVEVPIAQRKAWFQQLKREFPKSEWAKELQFYW